MSAVTIIFSPAQGSVLKLSTIQSSRSTKPPMPLVLGQTVWGPLDMRSAPMFKTVSAMPASTCSAAWVTQVVEVLQAWLIQTPLVRSLPVSAASQVAL